MRSWLRLLICGGVTAAAMLGTARADDSEIYISQSTTAPNIMLILDTSGSMGGTVRTQDPYDPARDYISGATGDCSGIAGRVFFKTSSQGTPPACNSNNYVPDTVLNCDLAKTALASSAGSYPGDRFVQWRSEKKLYSWRSLNSGTRTTIDCKKDGSPYPEQGGTGSTDTPAYTSSDNDSLWESNADAGSSATLYSANYVAYYNQFRNAVVSTRLQVMQQAAKNLLNAVSNVNVGLMRYSLNNGSSTASNPAGNGGGMILAPVAPIAQNRAQLIALIDAFVASGNTPLSETLYEAHQYFSGSTVYFGDHSEGCYKNASGSSVCETILSVADSRTGGTATSTTYASPAVESCQKNYIIYLTDGEPTSDTQADALIKGLPSFSSLVPTGCTTNSSGQGQCLGALSEYMFDKDLRSGVSGEQNVTSYYIGFGSDFGTSTSDSAFQFLVDAGTRGGGTAYKAGDLSELTEVFTNIFNAISSSSATLTAPTVAVNAFNRTRTLNDLYISVFQPTGALHWPGNIKKYRIDEDDDSTVIARGGVDAIGENGMFLSDTSDYWSTTNADGGGVGLGGAARKIPSPQSRNLYTYIGNNPTGTAGVAFSAVNTGNAAITDTVLGTDTTNNPLKEKLINWARGADVDDLDDDTNVEEQRYDAADPNLLRLSLLGDAMHSQPAVVIYGGTTSNPNVDDSVVFAATNDGYLHAFDTTTGTELWAYIPQEMLPELKSLYEDDPTAKKNYLIDGDLRVLKYDVNADGIVDTQDNDRVLLFFSTGRNAKVSRYYALDITSKSSPKFLWAIGPTQLPGLGQAWSRPTITRVNVNGATQNTLKLALVFGGGYDALEDGTAYVEETDVGNRIFMVDALRGTLLWSVGAEDDGTDLELERMTHSIPAPINVVDLDGDGFVDRMYVGDMAAQLWRFDVFNGNQRSELVTGGVMASLGARDEATASAAVTRRFYNSPDASLMQRNNRQFINVAIGSGYRGHPLTTSNQDRFYSIRDYQPYAKLTQDEYDALDIVTDAELDDITTDLSPQLSASSLGWKLQLNDPSYRGEKALSSSTTLDGKIFFTTYTPSASAASNVCSVAVGSNRAYVISALDGSPVSQRDSTTDPDGNTDPNDSPTRQDRYVELGQTGIAPEVTLLFPENDEDPNKITCLAGVEVLSVCQPFDKRIKTYWRQTNAN